MFRDEVAASQPTPEERIRLVDAEHLTHQQARRNLAAEHWRWGRKMLNVHAEIAPAILAKWESSSIPPTAAYFADFVRRELRHRGIMPAED